MHKQIDDVKRNYPTGGIAKTSYHAHTSYCNHAIGTAKELCAAAYKNGFKIFGFSEHVHFESEVGSDRRTSKKHQESLLLDEVPKLKKKYEDKMEVLMGFECEWFPGEEDYLRELLMHPECDYLILGNHYKTKLDNAEYYPLIVADDKELLNYTESTIAAIESGLYIYVAHPSIYMRSRVTFGPLEQECARRIIEAAVKHNMPLGINVNGISKGYVEIGNEIRYNYPHMGFFQMAGKMGAQVIIELDVHNPKLIEDDDSWDIAERMCRQYNLSRINKLDIEGYQRKVGKIK